MEIISMKLCIQCRHSRQIGQEAECWHPDNVSVSPVHGRKIARLACAYLRATEELCGPEGRWHDLHTPRGVA